MQGCDALACSRPMSCMWAVLQLRTPPCPRMSHSDDPVASAAGTAGLDASEGFRCTAALKAVVCHEYGNHALGRDDSSAA